MVAHRRAGKTVACVNEAVGRAIYSKKKRPRYAYIGPILKQTKKIAWEYLKEGTEGLRTKKPSETELSVILDHNKAEIGVYGADNPDSFRGQYFDGVILDEYGDMHPGVWTKNLLPTLADRTGWAVFIGTPKGKNHFYKIYRRAQGLDLRPGDDPEHFRKNWYNFMLKASESGILSAEELLLQRSEQDPDEYLQEYECSFDAAVKGTYYAHAIAHLEAIGRITPDCAYDPDYPVFIALDLGYTDPTCIWYWQERPDGIAVIDYDEAQNKGLDFYFDLIGNKPYTYAKIWVPHDAKQKTLATKRSTIEQFQDADKAGRFRKVDGRPLLDLVPNLSLQSGIDAVRLMLKSTWFNPDCEVGIEALRSYKREWDEEARTFADKPNHDWASHPSDAFRYLCLVAQKRMLPVVEAPRRPIIIEAEPILLEPLFEDLVLSLNRRRR